jgi:hypothetical protein
MNANQWAKRGKEELDTLTEWVKNIRGMLKSQIRNIKTKICVIYPSVFTIQCSRSENVKLIRYQF